MARFAQPANYQITPPLQGVKPTLFKTTLRILGLVSTVAKQWDLIMDNHTFSEMDEPNDQDLVCFLRSAGSLSTFTDTNSTGITATITDGGKITFSSALDNEHYQIMLEKQITGLDSLKEVVIRIPQVFPYYDHLTAVKPTISVLVSSDGTNFTTKFSGVKIDSTMPSFSLSRYWFAGQASLKIRIDFGTFEGSASHEVFFPHAFTPIYKWVDWNNEAETMAQWVAAGIGLVAGAATGIGVETLRDRLVKSSPIRNIAAFAGQSAAITVEAIIGSLAYAIHKGWATWSDLTYEKVMAGATMSANLMGLGAAGAGFALNQMVGEGRTGDILNAIGAGAQGIGAAVAYLTVFSTCKRYVYC